MVVAAPWGLLESDPDPTTDGRDLESDSLAGESAITRAAAIGTLGMADGPGRSSGDVMLPDVVENVKGVAPDATEPPDEAIGARKVNGIPIQAQPQTIRLITCDWAGIFR